MFSSTMSNSGITKSSGSSISKSSSKLKKFANYAEALELDEDEAEVLVASDAVALVDSVAFPVEFAVALAVALPSVTSGSGGT